MLFAKEMLWRFLASSRMSQILVSRVCAAQQQNVFCFSFPCKKCFFFFLQKEVVNEFHHPISSRNSFNVLEESIHFCHFLARSFSIIIIKSSKFNHPIPYLMNLMYLSNPSICHFLLACFLYQQFVCGKQNVIWVILSPIFSLNAKCAYEESISPILACNQSTTYGNHNVYLLFFYLIWLIECKKQIWTWFSFFEFFKDVWGFWVIMVLLGVFFLGVFW